MVIAAIVPDNRLAFPPSMAVDAAVPEWVVYFDQGPKSRAACGSHLPVRVALALDWPSMIAKGRMMTPEYHDRTPPTTETKEMVYEYTMGFCSQRRG